VLTKKKRVIRQSESKERENLLFFLVTSYFLKIEKKIFSEKKIKMTAPIFIPPRRSDDPNIFFRLRKKFFFNFFLWGNCPYFSFIKKLKLNAFRKKTG